MAIVLFYEQQCLNCTDSKWGKSRKNIMKFFSLYLLVQFCVDIFIEFLKYYTINL